MAQTATDQLASIKAMLESGHHSVRMDSHSLIIWGLIGGFLCIVADLLVSPEYLPEQWQRALAILALVGGLLTFAGVLDFRITHRIRREKDQTVSFVQQQLTKVWWLLMSLGVLMTIGMEFFGGGYMSYSMWMFLIGLALTIHGLFSQQPLKWYGVLLLLLGVAPLVLQIPYEAIRWLAAAAFGIGLPIAGILIQRQRSISVVWLFGWIALVSAISAGIYILVHDLNVPQEPAISLQEYLDQDPPPEGTLSVAIPAGTSVPAEVVITSDTLEEEKSLQLPISLSKPLEVALRDGELLPWYRVDDGNWQTKDSGLRIRINELDTRIDPARGPVVLLKLDIRASR